MAVAGAAGAGSWEAGSCGVGARSSPVDSNTAASPEGSAVGASADSEAVSSGPQAGTSEMAFSVIARLAGGGQAAVCRGQHGRFWASRVPGTPRSRLI